MPPGGPAEIENFKSEQKVTFSISTLPPGDTFKV